MPGSLFNIIKRDAKFFINKGGYQVEILMTTPDNSLTISITGWAVKHSGSFDSDGNQVNTKNVHVTIDEDVLVALNYPYRSAKKASGAISEIDLNKHKISFADSSGIVKNYIVREVFPDENLGLIDVGLGDYIF